MKYSRLHELERDINYKFKNFELLILALNGAKVRNNKGRNNKTLKNETLAQLGDAILRLVIIEYFYDNNNEIDKGEIDQKLKEYASNEKLVDIRNKIQLENYIHNEINYYCEAPQNSKPALNKHDSYVEAIIGAIYKDGGYDEAKQWIIEIFKINEKF